MRIRHAATALVALGAASVCAVGIGMVHSASDTGTVPDVRTMTGADPGEDSGLRSAYWSVQSSTDFGTTWTAPVSSDGGHLPVRVDTVELRSRAAYQPLTLRTTVDSRDPAQVILGTGALLSGDPETAAEVRIRAVTTSATCAAPAFAAGATGLLAGSPEHRGPLDARATRTPITLPAGTRTTPGAPVTVCLEVSMEANAPVADSQLTVAWPLEVTRETTD